MRRQDDEWLHRAGRRGGALGSRSVSVGAVSRPAIRVWGPATSCGTLAVPRGVAFEVARGSVSVVTRPWLRYRPGGIADAPLARFSVGEASGRPVATYSGTMRRRLDTAMGSIGDPPRTLVDAVSSVRHPTTLRIRRLVKVRLGLDPDACR